MHKFVTVLTVAAACVALSGCLTAQIAKMTPEQQTGLVKALGDAGCGGDIDVRAGASTASGISAGSASGSFEFKGSCHKPLAVGDTVGNTQH